MFRVYYSLRSESPSDFALVATLVATLIAFTPKIWLHAILKEGVYISRASSRITIVDMSWPPYHLSQESELYADKAELLIARGALSFEGIILEANHTFIRQSRFYATVSIVAAGKSLEASSRPDSTLADTSLVLSGQPLEQPSMAQGFGELPGTITFGRYVNAVSGPRQTERLPEYKIRPRATDNLLVLQRLYYLMKNGWVEEVRKKEPPIVLDEGTDKEWG